MKHCKDCRVELIDHNRRGAGRFCDACRERRGMCPSDDPKYVAHLARLHARYEVQRRLGVVQKPRDNERERGLLRSKTAKFGVNCAALWEEQKGLCGVCHQPMVLGDRGPLGAQVDHDRSCCKGGFSCGRCVREFVHAKCNRVLAQSREDPQILSGALQYIQKWRGNQRPTAEFPSAKTRRLSACNAAVAVLREGRHQSVKWGDSELLRQIASRSGLIHGHPGVREAAVLEALSKVPGQLVPGYFTGLDSMGKRRRVRIFWLPEHTPTGVRANYSRLRRYTPQPVQRTDTDVCLCGHTRGQHEGRGRNRQCKGAGANSGGRPVCQCTAFCRKILPTDV